MISRKVILVTGAPRSGTSWVGRMIANAPSTCYVHEPFNITGRPCHCGVKFEYWFSYLSPENELDYQTHLEHTIFPAFKRTGLVNLITELSQSKRIRPILRYLQSYYCRRTVVKAPGAVFSACTLASLFNMKVVVVIRHPAAVVNSYKTLNWNHPFSHFLNQPELIEEHLALYRTEIENFSKNEYDIVDTTALLWKLIHLMIIKYRETRSEWIFIKYEDLVLDPIKGYQEIFDQIELPFSDRTHRVIQAHHLQKRLPKSADPYDIKQNPHQVLSKWKKELTPSEVNRIRHRVEDISSAFYSDADWIL